MSQNSKIARTPLWPALLATAAAQASDPVEAVHALLRDSSDIGLSTGGSVPEFHLKDQNGHTRDIHSLMGAKGLVLVFFRSADW